MRRRKMLQIAAWDYAFRVHLLPLVEACSEAGFEVICCGAPGPFAREIEAQGYQYAPVGFSRSFSPGAHLHALWDLVRLMRKERPEVVHTHTLIGGLLGRMAAWMADVPVSVYTAHGFHFHENMEPLPYWFYVVCEAIGASLGDFLMVQNPEDRVTALGLRFCSPESIQVIGNGIDLRRFNRENISPESLQKLRISLNIPRDARIVTTIARPTPEKGVPEFLNMAREAHREAPNLCFLAVLPRMKGERRAYSLTGVPENVRVLGFRRDIPEILALSDVFVLPSRFEGVSKTIVEAMAMSVPVVANNVRGCRGVVEDGETGFLVDSGDTQELKRAVFRILHNKDLSQRLSKEARRRAEAHFDEKSMIQRQLQIFARLSQPSREAAHA